MQSRITFVSFFFVLIYVSFLARAFWLKVFPDDRLIAAKKRNFEKVIKLKPRRGIIYDRQGRELAISISSKSLFADPSLVKNPKGMAKKLNRLLRIPYSRLYKKLTWPNKRFVWLKRHITEEQWEKISRWKEAGLSYLEEPKRVYPNGQLLSQTLGFVGQDGYGLEGIELTFNKILSGEEKKVLVQKDARNRPLFSNIHADLIHLSSNGSDITLSIDSDLQFYLEKELQNAINTYRAKSARGVIMDPKSGHILAIANIPTFDLNRAFKAPSSVHRNRVIVDSFEPGSTLKPFVVATALQNHIPPTKRYSGQDGKLLVDGHVIKEAEQTKSFKDVSLRQILALSSNIGAAQLALDLGGEKLFQGLKSFGFGEKTHITFPGEAFGILHSPPWRDIKTATIGFGHGIAITALQLATAYSTIASGGIYRKPILVTKAKHKESGRVVEHPKVYQSARPRRVMSPELANILTVMLISATSPEGTGSSAQVKGYLVAGKTGTAQVVGKQGYAKGQYISSFAGFIPAQKPQFVIVVVVEHPQGEIYGSKVAAPVFSMVAEYALRQYGVSPILISEKHILKPTDGSLKPDGVHLSQEQRSLSSAHQGEKASSSIGLKAGLEKSAGDKEWSFDRVPDFKGLSLRRAYLEARKQKLKLKIRGSGLVVRTNPKAGSPLPPNKTVTLIMNN